MTPVIKPRICFICATCGYTITAQNAAAALAMLEDHRIFAHSGVN